MSVADALQLMLAFGTFIVALVALIVELIKSQQKFNNVKLCHRLKRLYMGSPVHAGLSFHVFIIA